jgi:YgiT-type zinc finger domain-containing protein
MKCGQAAYKSVTSEAIELGFGLLVIRNIPCYKCEECDEIFYTGDVVQKVESIIDEAKRLMQKIRVIEYWDAA